MYISNIDVCVNELVFSVYSALVYHLYTNPNIGPWGVGTRLQIFPTSKQQKELDQ